MLNIIFETVTTYLPGVIFTGICGLIGKFAVDFFVHTSEFSGLWADEVCDPYGALVKKDIFFMRHNKHDNTIKGEIIRIMPTSQNYRKWHFTGVVNNNHIIFSYWGNNKGIDSDGAIVTKLSADSTYTGYYLRDNESQNGRIDKFNIRLKRIHKRSVKYAVLDWNNTLRRKVRYAVLDWDNTFRDGYTLYSLIEYLLEEKFIDIKIEEELKILLESYKKNEISHDDFAEKACAEFAFALNGKEKSQLLDCIKGYRNTDVRKLYNFTATVFNTLKSLDIKPIIISGAPKFIIDMYCKQFDIFAVFAFDLKIDKNGIFTGDVFSNSGYDKDVIIDNLIKTFKTTPCIAFGDSLSDMPLFKNSKLNYLVSQDSFPGIKNIQCINKNTPGENITAGIKKMFDRKGIFGKI